TKDELGSAVAIVAQLSGFLTRQNTDKQIASLTEQDVFILPQLGDIASASFKRAEQTLAIGQTAAAAVADQLTRYALGEAQYAQHIAARGQPPQGQPIIGFIRVDNQSSIGDDVIRARLRQQTGEPLNLTQLEQDLGKLYGLDIFESVRYDLVRERADTGVVVSVKEKSWGPRYLQFGARLSSDFGNEQELGLVLGYTVTPINRLGGEWRSILRLGEEQGVVTEFYQPVAFDSPYFVLPRLFYLNQRFNETEDGRRVAENRVARVGGEVIVGRELGTWGRLSAGLVRATGEISTRIGESETEPDIDDGSFFAAFDLDTLNNVNFPTSGMRGQLRWNGSRTGLGADTRYDQLLFDAVGARTWGRHTLLLGGRYFTTVDGEAPTQNLFRTGGLFELPGFAENALSGQHLVLLRSGYQRALRDLFGFPAYLALTLQLGNVYEDEDDIGFGNAITAGSAYLGLNTLLGPLYIGYGYAEGGENSLYLLLGNQF
ncbi:MAG: BamA/TamA family outer membrane protein, partial [Gammaproteobacteria bacterium]|nr:BamA/TamA family outer membrane protein [Gammaproteobacteria bacterium]